MATVVTTGRMKPCVRCGHLVGSGGDRHANDACPPRPKPGENHRARHRLRRRGSYKVVERVERSGPVKGTGKRGNGSGGKKG